MPQAFFKLLFLSYISRGCFSYCLRVGTVSYHSPGSPRQSLLIFMVPGFKSHWLQELLKFGPSNFQSQMLWGFVFSMLAPQFDSLFLSPLQQEALSLQWGGPQGFSSPPLSGPFHNLFYAASLYI